MNSLCRFVLAERVRTEAYLHTLGASEPKLIPSPMIIDKLALIYRLFPFEVNAPCNHTFRAAVIIPLFLSFFFANFSGQILKQQNIR